MTAFPTLQALQDASPADLGLVALRGMVNIEDTQRATHRMNPMAQTITLTRKALQDGILNGVTGQHDAPIAAEAVAWLISHGLVAQMAQIGTPAEVIFTTRLGREVVAAAPTSAAGVAVSLRVVELLPIAIRQRAMTPLLSGDFDLAITASCKAVEIRMRERANLPTSDFGARLARKFFSVTSSTSLGRADQSEVADERKLFEGIFGLYRDRAVHEIPHIDSAEYALEVIIAAAHLLRIVEAAIITPVASGEKAAPTA